jgi:protein-L-isoaspartate(D-aspartate) O-methyltransferase
MTDLERLRREMVERQLVARGIRDPAVLKAMGEVPREEFAPAHKRDIAYWDSPLPIGRGQTISQPYVVAWMIQSLELGQHKRVLEIGTGSGYAAAVLSRIASEVFTVERHADLARTAENCFQRLEYDNIRVRVGDGSLGWREHAPYEAILVSAGGPEIPAPLLEQLSIAGRLIIPIGARRDMQQLLRVRRIGPTEYRQETLGNVRFVPLIGEAGWPPNSMSS